jgi:hypothetical protein
VAYPEMISPLNRRFRTEDLAKKDYDLLVKNFANEWRHFAAIDFDEIAAGQLSETCGLRGFDAVHFSAALMLKTSGGVPAIVFSLFDHKLNDAAASEKLKALFPQS